MAYEYNPNLTGTSRPSQSLRAIDQQRNPTVQQEQPICAGHTLAALPSNEIISYHSRTRSISVHDSPYRASTSRQVTHQEVIMSTRPSQSQNRVPSEDSDDDIVVQMKMKKHTVEHMVDAQNTRIREQQDQINSLKSENQIFREANSKFISALNKSSEENEHQKQENIQLQEELNKLKLALSKEKNKREAAERRAHLAEENTSETIRQFEHELKETRKNSWQNKTIVHQAHELALAHQALINNDSAYSQMNDDDLKEQVLTCTGNLLRTIDTLKSNGYRFSED